MHGSHIGIPRSIPSRSIERVRSKDHRICSSVEMGEFPWRCAFAAHTWKYFSPTLFGTYREGGEEEDINGHEPSAISNVK